MNQEEYEKWLEFRRQLCTGTKVAPILGQGSFRTAYDVFVRVKQLLPLEPPTAAMRRGTLLEGGILDFYDQELDVKVARQSGTFVHPHEDWMGASPDGFHEEDGELVIVDAKTSRDRHKWGAAGSDDVPVDYACQLQWYAAVLGAHFDKPVRRLDVAVYFPVHDEFSIFNIAPDEELQQKLIEKCREWWYRHIISNVAPPIDHGTLATKLVNQTPHGNDNFMELDAGTADIVERLKEVKKDIASLTKEKGMLENTIKEVVGTNLGLVGNGHRVTWKEQKGRSSWDTKQLAVDHPELAEAYKKPGKPYRVLRIK